MEQVEAEIRSALSALQLLWDEKGGHDGKVGVHVLMGGADSGVWHLYPEQLSVLIGTQDMLLSRTLNRGYGSPRARWPMEYGLLNQDSLWVLDEVQLMDVGLATSAQLQAFRDQDQADGKTQRPCVTWWMSATLQHNWLSKSPDTRDLMTGLEKHGIRIPAPQRQGVLWDDVSKPLELVEFKHPKALAKEIAERHIQLGSGTSGLTLVVLNTVDRALDVWQSLLKNKNLKSTDIRLVHSRFRPAERARWQPEFLNRVTCSPGVDRIIVATQVIEAGVNISSALLVTELAPWASLIQRFGRCARWGGEGRVLVADLELKNPAPYSPAEIAAAKSACGHFNDVAPIHLERFEDEHPELQISLYPYHPDHLLLRHELDELFDTTPDLSGADIDISRFIRSGEERDLQVFWANTGGSQPSADLKPTRSALCSVPFLKARDWLCGKETGSGKRPRLRKGLLAWVWSWNDREWRLAERRDLYPGQTVLVAPDVGGYDPQRGWSPESTSRVVPVELAGQGPARSRPCWRTAKERGWEPSERSVRDFPPDESADASEEDESLSIISEWQTIATHGQLTGAEACRISQILAPNICKLLDLAGRWHDIGKAHPAFQGSIHAIHRPERDDIAKAPDEAWPCHPAAMYRIDTTQQRRGFRHELASTLALFSVLQRHTPEHSALLGPWKDFPSIAASGPDTAQELGEDAGATPQPTPLEQEVLELDADEFDLLAYLVCAHHGKVRMAWHASPADQNAKDDAQLRIRGVRDGDILPAMVLRDGSGNLHELPASVLDLSPASCGLSPRTGSSWTERILGLLERHGSFSLAWMEALVRAADQRISRKPLVDPLLENHNKNYELENHHRTVAPTAPERAVAHPFNPNPPQSSPEHGIRGRASGRKDAGSGTQTPHHATRYLKTRLGILTYAQLAPHLSRRVQELEADIATGRYADHPLDEHLIQEFHRRICGDLVSDMAGHWRRINVRVSAHEAPNFQCIRELMRNYCLDLQARLAAFNDPYDELMLEFLAFAEGRLLWIHPFEDFNGRTTRVLLAELLRRLQLPALDPTPDPGAETSRYLEALRASDRADWSPLKAIWLTRFGKEGQA